MSSLMVAVAIVVAVGYAALSFAVDDRPGVTVESFGNPWTFNEFLDELRKEGVELDIEPHVVDQRSFLAQEAMRTERPIVSRNRNGVSVLVFPTVEERRRTWPDSGRPRTLSGGPVIIEAHSFRVENVVVIVGFTQHEPSSPTLSEIRRAMQSVGTH